MKLSFRTALLILALILFTPSLVLAHSGGTDDAGGHRCWTNCAQYGLESGEYHFHHDGDSGSDSGGTSDAVDTTRPTVKLITPFVSTRISKTTTFKVRWSATDASGIASYLVRFRPANSSKWTNWKTNTTSTYAYFKGTAGRTYYFRVRAKDKAGNYGWSKIMKTIVPYNEGANIRKKFGFHGYYKSGKSSNYLTSIRYSFTRGNTLVYKLPNTNGVGLVTTKGSNRGRAKIYIDGHHMATVNAYSSKLKPRQLIYYFSFSKKGTHYLKIVNEGTPGRARFDVDGIVAGR